METQYPRNIFLNVLISTLLLMSGDFVLPKTVAAITIDIPPEAQSQLGTTSLTIPKVQFPTFSPYVFYLKTDPVQIVGQPTMIEVKASGAQVFDYANATFTWYLNSILDQTQSGVGKSSFTFTPKDTRTYIIKVLIKLGNITDTQQTIVQAQDENDFVNSRLLEKFQTLEQRDAEFKKRQAEKGLDALGRASLSASNENPVPGETVDVLFQSYSVDLNRSFIQWFINDKKYDEGTGKTVIYVTMGGVGEKSKIRAVAKTESGEIIEAMLSLTPFELSLYWWTDSSVPYWYKGKALPNANSQIYVSAFPRTLSLSAQQKYIYKWSLNDAPQILSSGYSKQLFSFKASLPQLADRVTVSIENFEKTFTFAKTISVLNVEPEIYVCVAHLTRGCIRTPATLIAAGDTVDLKAQPFFFASPASVRYDWNIDGIKPTTPATTRPWLLTIKAPDILQGLLNVKISASDKKYKNVTADNSFSIEIRQ